MIIFTSDQFVNSGVHMLGNCASTQRSALPNTLVKETATRIKNSAVQTIKIDFFHKLSFVPERNFLCILCIFFLGLQFFSLTIPTLKQTWNNTLMLKIKDSSISTQCPRRIVVKNHIMNFCSTMNFTCAV